MSFNPPVLTTSPLTNDEKDSIAILMGYNKSNVLIYQYTTDLNNQQILLIRSSLAEINRLDLLMKQSVTQSKAVRVDDMYLNTGYLNDLNALAAREINKIAAVIQMVVLNNFYLPSNNIYGATNRVSGCSVR